MPSSPEHQAKYAQNRAFLNAGGGLAATEPAWAAVVAFYAALHLVERLAARQNLHHTQRGAHGQRFRYLAIVRDFEKLRDASEIARYGTINQFQQLFPGSAVQTTLIDNHLVAIENYVDFVFNPPPPAPPSAGT